MQAPLGPSPVDLALQARVPPNAQKKADLLKAAQEFEGMVLSQLMQSMRSTVHPSGLFGEAGQSRSTYEYLLDQAVISKAIQGGRGLGLAAQLQRVWEERQRTQVEPKTPGGLGKPGEVPIE